MPVPQTARCESVAANRLRPGSYPAANLFLTVACAYITYVAFRRIGAEHSWYPIASIMQQPWEHGVFGHRLVFVGIAWLAKLAAPSISLLRAFYVSQIVAILFSFGAMALLIRRLHGPRYVGFGSALLCVLMVPVFGYFNFYDIATPGFYALALYLFLEKRYAAYLLVFAVALNNHENIVMLTPITALELWLQDRRRLAVGMFAGHVLIYLAQRAVFSQLFPSDRLFDSGFDYNIHFYRTYAPWNLLAAAVTTSVPYLAALIGWRRSPRLLQIAFVVIAPGLVVLTTLFGQYTETRQFIAMIPIAIPMLLYCVRAELESGEKQPL